MAEDEYEDNVSDSSEASAEKPDKKDASTALLPKTMFPENVRPGYKCEIEVVGVESEEVIIKKLPHKKETSEPESKLSTEMASSTTGSDDYA